MTLDGKPALGVNQDGIIFVIVFGPKDQAAIMINGKEVISVNGQPPQGGSLIGFKVASGPEGANSVGFSNLQVTQP